MKQRIATPVLVLVAVVLAIGLAGCSSDSDNDSGGDGGSSRGLAADSGATQADEFADELHIERAANSPKQNQPEDSEISPALIKKGTVESRSDDVGKAQFEVQRVVDRYSGQVTDEQTTTDDDGHPAYTRMVLRVPSDSFDDTMAALKKIGELQSANTSQQDVTTKLIDTRTRLTVQKQSIRRITTLFDQAESIRDIMSIESELSRRQADLESLERQAAYLTGQTTRSTITVSIDQTPKKAVAAAADDDNGFVSGLKAGWNGLSATAAALATAFGALLPWLVVIAILGPPSYLLIRVVRRRINAGKSGRTPSAA